ncbi:hypothetical protein BDZ97DRAFT_1912904 [Flammula alnicola]|nr:hypothetical protein BDZ97DRAFT_1912904 [Flammula alnicola]
MSSHDLTPSSSMAADVGVFDIYEFIRPAFAQLKSCLQDGIDPDTASAALQSQLFLMGRFLSFADAVDSEYLIPDDIHAFRALHADLAKHVAPDQLAELCSENWIIDDPDRAPLSLDYEFPPAVPGSLPFMLQRQKQAEDFMHRQREERARRVAAQNLREERKRLAAARAQEELEKVEREVEVQRQAEAARRSSIGQQAALDCPQPVSLLDLDALIPLSEGDIDVLDPTPPLLSSKAAGKRKRDPSLRRPTRKTPKSRATVSESEEDAAPPGSAGPSKRTKYAPSRPHTKIRSQEAFLEDARSLWEQTPAGLRANQPPPLIDAAQLKVFRRGFKPQVESLLSDFVTLLNETFYVSQINSPCFACVMGDTQQHCKFLGFGKGCPPCVHHKRGRCSFLWAPEERAYYREHAFSLGRDSLASFQDDLRDIQFHTSQGLISARQAETSFAQADRLAGRFTQRILDFSKCVDFVLERASNVDTAQIGYNGLPLIDELLLFLDPNVFERLPTTSWEHTVLQYRLYRERKVAAEKRVEPKDFVDDEAEEAPSDEDSDGSSPRRPRDPEGLFKGFKDSEESVGSRSDPEI